MYQGFTFKGKAKDETVLFRARLHWVPLMRRLLLHGMGWSVCGALVAIVAALITDRGSRSIMDIVTAGWGIHLWFAATLTGLFYAWMTWYLSMFVITDRRLLQMVQTGLFSHYTLELKLENVRDTAFSYNHVLHHLFNYGTMFARSSTGAIGDFEVPNLPNARDVHHYVHKIIVMLDEAKRAGTLPVLPEFRHKWGKKHMSKAES